MSCACETTARKLEFDLVLAVVILEASLTHQSDLAVSGDTNLLVIDTGLDVDGVRLAVVRKSGNGSRDVVVLACCGILRHDQSS